MQKTVANDHAEDEHYVSPWGAREHSYITEVLERAEEQRRQNAAFAAAADAGDQAAMDRAVNEMKATHTKMTRAVASLHTAAAARRKADAQRARARVNARPLRRIDVNRHARGHRPAVRSAAKSASSTADPDGPSEPPGVARSYGGAL